MSPEQVLATGEVDGRSDIYSMGAVLHEMLTGKKLFDADSSFAVMLAQTKVVPQPPSAYNPEVPAAVDAVVAKALEKNPAARFQSALEFRTALEAAAAVDAPRSSRAPVSAWLRPGYVILAFAALSALLWPRI